MRTFRFFLALPLLLVLLLPAGVIRKPGVAMGAGGIDFGEWSIEQPSPLPTPATGGGTTTPDSQVSDALAGTGTQAEVGFTDGGVPGAPYNAYVSGMNRRIVESLRRPNVSTAKSAARETKQSLFEWAQTFVLESLKKRILDMMSAEIVQWVQGGEEPRFVTDWQGFLEDAGDIATAGLVKELNADFICAPFAPKIQAMFAPEIAPQSQFRKDSTCSLDNIVDNINTFRTDFSSGGWIGYQEAWEPQNNIFGVYLMTQRERNRRTFLAERAAQNDALAGGGFPSPKACREAIGGTSTDLDKDGIKGDIAESCNIVTPGSVVEELTKRAFTADIDFVISANQLSTYLAAIADAAFNRLIRDGASGLRGLSTENAPAGGSLAEGTNGCGAFPSGSPLRDACEGYVVSNDGNFVGSRDDVLADIANARIQYVIARTEVEGSIAISRNLVTTLKEARSGCTSQSEIDQVEAKIAELLTNIIAFNTIISQLDAAVATIAAISPTDGWAALTQAANTIGSNGDINVATEIAQTAAGQYDNMATAAGLITARVNACSARSPQ